VGSVVTVAALAVALMVACSAPTGGVPMFIDISSDRLTASLDGELAIRDDCLVLDARIATYAIAWHSSVTTWQAAERRIEVGGGLWLRIEECVSAPAAASRRRIAAQPI
jgi:hypothetical protein